MKYALVFFLGLYCGVWTLYLVESYQRQQREKAYRHLIEILHQRGWPDSSIKIVKP